MRRVGILLVMMLASAGCGDNERVDFGGEELGPDVHAIVSEDGSVKMGLTRDWLYVALSDSARAAARSELAEDASDGFFAGIFQNLVGKALDFRARYAVAEIEEIYWADGQLKIEFTDPDRRMDDNLQLGEDQSVTDAFSEASVRELAAAFDSLKSGW